MKLIIETHGNYVYFILCCHHEKRFTVRYIVIDLLSEFSKKFIALAFFFLGKVKAYFVLTLTTNLINLMKMINILK